jgi:glycosyltransferase involved in cell wall biosynthesis
LWRDETKKRGISNVSFAGFVAPSEIVDYQVGADVLLSYYPSGIDLNDYRSPGKLFEYMASGTPIIAADYASLREVLKDGRNAILIEPDKPELLALAIGRLLSDPALGARLGSQAREDAMRYTWAARAEAISTFVSSLENM